MTEGRSALKKSPMSKQEFLLMMKDQCCTMAEQDQVLESSQAYRLEDKTMLAGYHR